MEGEQPTIPAPAAPREPLLARLRALPVERRRRLALALAAGVTLLVVAAVAVYRSASGADSGSFVRSATAAAAVLGERFSGIISWQI